MTKDVQPQVGFLGGGQIASALIQGLTASKIISPSQVVVCDPSANQRDLLAQRFSGIQFAERADDLFRSTSRIVLALKPQVFHLELPVLKTLATSKHILVSVIAGVSLDLLTAAFGTNRIVRVMPNTPCRVGEGAAAYSVAPGVESEDVRWVESMMRAVGTVIRVEDRQMHSVTALSGSGPAYVLLGLEAMIEGGVAAGLSREVASQLALQTLYGTAKLVMETGEHPAQLREQVTSPAGTTAAGLQVLESRAVRSAYIDAILTATERGKQLATSVL